MIDYERSQALAQRLQGLPWYCTFDISRATRVMKIPSVQKRLTENEREVVVRMGHQVSK